MVSVLLHRLVRLAIPTLEKYRAVVPVTVKLLYNLILTRGTDLNTKFVNNLGHEIIES